MTAGRQRAVIFDNDGVLVDSEPLHRVAWERTFGPRGVVVPGADYDWSIGRRDATFAGIIAERFGLPDTPESLVDEKRSHLVAMLEQESQTFDGLPELVRAIVEEIGIERPGGAESLNAAVAGSIAMYTVAGRSPGTGVAGAEEHRH